MPLSSRWTRSASMLFTEQSEGRRCRKQHSQAGKKRSPGLRSTCGAKVIAEGGSCRDCSADFQTAWPPALSTARCPAVPEPHLGFGIARGAPIAARRERTARAHLRAVRDGRALELADLEEAIQEYVQPLLDRGQVVFVALLGGQQVGPGAAVLLAPGMPGQECHFAGPEPVPRDEVQVEVLQLVRAHLVRGLLRRLGGVASRGAPARAKSQSPGSPPAWRWSPHRTGPRTPPSGSGAG